MLGGFGQPPPEEVASGGAEAGIGIGSIGLRGPVAAKTPAR